MKNKVLIVIVSIFFLQGCFVEPPTFGDIVLGNKTIGSFNKVSVSLEEVTSQEVTIRWEKVENAKSYRLIVAMKGVPFDCNVSGDEYRIINISDTSLQLYSLCLWRKPVCSVRKWFFHDKNECISFNCIFS